MFTYGTRSHSLCFSTSKLGNAFIQKLRSAQQIAGKQRPQELDNIVGRTGEQWQLNVPPSANLFEHGVLYPVCLVFKVVVLIPLAVIRLCVVPDQWQNQSAQSRPAVCGALCIRIRPILYSGRDGWYVYIVLDQYESEYYSCCLAVFLCSYSYGMAYGQIKVSSLFDRQYCMLVR